MARFEACLLDYGNTVIEFDRRQLNEVLAGLARFLGERLRPVDLDELRAATRRVTAVPFVAGADGSPPTYRELSPHDFMVRLLEKVYGSELEASPELVAECDHALQETFLASVSLDSGSSRSLAEIRGRCPVGLVSNYSCGRTLRRSLEALGIAAIFDPVVISGELGWVKPHPKAFRAALELLGLPPEKVLFVGDRWDADMVGAMNVGMKTCHHVGFTTDRDYEERYLAYRPDYTIERLEELLPIIADGSPPEE